jgi:sugar transferase (PEP-CTERM/EpsH1 system associated)
MEDLLFLSQRIPYPPTKGDKIRSWHILRHLASHYRVHLGCFIDDRHDDQFRSVVADLCASVHCEPLNPALAKIRSLAAILRGEPMTLRYFGSRRLQTWVDDTVQRNRVKYAFVYCSAMAPYVVGLAGATRVLDMVDIDSQKWRQYAQASKKLARFIYAREGDCLLRFERAMARSFDRTLLVSPAEADFFHRLAPESADRVIAVTNGVDLDYFSPARSYSDPFRSDTLKIVFTGAMDYRPNVEAAQWFVRCVMPELALAGRALEFWIVGANPTPAIRRLEEQRGVRVTGRVADIRPYLAHAAVAVAPLLTARGIQNKVLEAMAMAKPVVATPEAKEGIDAVAGEELLVAADPKAFASMIGIALTDRGDAIGKRARQRVESDFVWAERLETIRHLFGTSQASGIPVADSPARQLAQ